jgi:hypothetical protein
MSIDLKKMYSFDWDETTRAPIVGGSEKVPSPVWNFFALLPFSTSSLVHRKGVSDAKQRNVLING